MLTEGDDNNDPVADNARAILDGHIVLARPLAERGQYPAIDIEASISRVMNMVTTPEHLAQARKFRHYYSLYEQNQDLFNVGAYQAGTNPELDRAVALRGVLTAFMRQDPDQSVGSADALDMLNKIFPTAA